VAHATFPPRIAAAGAVAGLALVGGVVAWRLVTATVRADFETICHAEGRSGLTLGKDMPALTVWLRGHLATPAGNELLSRLGDAPMADRGPRLRSEAAASGIGACPIAQSYDALAIDGAYRADLQRLCSYVTFPDLAERDDAGRLAAVEDWIASAAANARTRALAGPLRDANAPAERARVLRAASREMDIFTCDTAKTLETPQPSPDAGE